MTYQKSHFRYTKGQRNGIFLLLLIIIVLQSAYLFIDRTQYQPIVESSELIEFQHEIDSLRQIAIEKKKPIIYPFNPNYISDFKGYTLGMTLEEIDRLHKFREQNKWINSKTQFQQVTLVSDSLLEAISLYF